jgi:hypothetical protein
MNKKKYIIEQHLTAQKKMMKKINNKKMNIVLKQETFIIASDQMKAHFPRTIVKNPDFH